MKDMKLGSKVRALVKLARDESGQAMTEYVVIMVVVAAFTMLMLDPTDTGLGFFSWMRMNYNFIAHAMCMPGP